MHGKCERIIGNIPMASSRKSYIVQYHHEPQLRAEVLGITSDAQERLQTGTVKYVPNKYAYGTHEVGLHVTHLLLKEKAGAVIAANIGPQPYEHLGARGVKIYGGAGRTVLDAVRSFQANMLPRLT